MQLPTQTRGWGGRDTRRLAPIELDAQAPETERDMAPLDALLAGVRMAAPSPAFVDQVMLAVRREQRSRRAVQVTLFVAVALTCLTVMVTASVFAATTLRASGGEYVALGQQILSQLGLVLRTLAGAGQVVWRALPVHGWVLLAGWLTLGAAVSAFWVRTVRSLRLA